MLNFQYVLPFPIRVRASGTLTVNGNSGTTFGSTDGRQGLYAVVISNLDAANKLYLRDATGIEWAVIWPSVSEIFLCNEDFEVYNPNGVAVSYMVGRQFLNAGVAGSGRGRAAEFAPDGGVVPSSTVPSSNGVIGTNSSGQTVYQATPTSNPRTRTP